MERAAAPSRERILVKAADISEAPCFRFLPIISERVGDCKNLFCFLTMDELKKVPGARSVVNVGFLFFASTPKIPGLFPNPIHRGGKRQGGSVGRLRLSDPRSRADFLFLTFRRDLY